MLSNETTRPNHKPEVVSKRKNRPEHFCTECGDGLEDFCFSETANDVEAVRKMFASCKKKHRFTGGLCAKLFIAGPMEVDDPNNPDEGQGL